MTQTPTDKARVFLKPMEVLDCQSTTALGAPDCASNNPPPIGTVIGPTGVSEVLARFLAPRRENEFRILRDASDGSAAIRNRLDRRRLADKRDKMSITGVFEIHDGLITCWRDYFDAATIQPQRPAV